MILCGDCEELLKTIKPKSVDLVVTDPPYDGDSGAMLRAKSGSFHKAQTRKAQEIVPLYQGYNYDLVPYLLFDVCKKPNAYFWCSKKQIKKYLDVQEKYNLKFELITWNKTNSIPAINKTFRSDTEYVVYLYKGITFNGGVDVRTHWYVSPILHKEKRKWEHPTIKPVNILRNFILCSSSPGDVVLDPFMGTGSTGVAALTSQREFVGMEINPRWFAIAEQRIEDARNNVLFNNNEKQQELF